MLNFQQRGEELEDNLAECERLLEEAQGRLGELEEGRKEGEEDEERKTELEKIQAEMRKLKKDKKSFEKMLEEHRREEKKLPWNVDTISKEGFNKVRRGVFSIQCYISHSLYPNLILSFILFSRVFSTLSLSQRRIHRRKRWRSTRPLWKNMQRKSDTLVYAFPFLFPFFRHFCLYLIVYCIVVNRK